MNPGDLVGPYRVLEKFGEGGMGEVYKARDTRIDRSVAIKVLPAAASADPEADGRFEREARALASLSHPRRDDDHLAGCPQLGERAVALTAHSLHPAAHPSAKAHQDAREEKDRDKRQKHVDDRGRRCSASLRGIGMLAARLHRYRRRRPACRRRGR
jgi:serine/threonine protein kinase